MGTYGAAKPVEDLDPLDGSDGSLRCPSFCLVFVNKLVLFNKPSNLGCAENVIAVVLGVLSELVSTDSEFTPMANSYSVIGVDDETHLREQRIPQESVG